MEKMSTYMSILSSFEGLHFLKPNTSCQGYRLSTNCDCHCITSDKVGIKVSYILYKYIMYSYVLRIPRLCRLVDLSLQWSDFRRTSAILLKVKCECRAFCIIQTLTVIPNPPSHAQKYLLAMPSPLALPITAGFIASSTSSTLHPCIPYQFATPVTGCRLRIQVSSGGNVTICCRRVESGDLSGRKCNVGRRVIGE